MNRRCGAEGGRLGTVSAAVALGVLFALGPAVLRAVFAQDVPDSAPPAGGGGVDLGPLLGGLGAPRLARRRCCAGSCARNEVRVPRP